MESKWLSIHANVPWQVYKYECSQPLSVNKFTFSDLFLQLFGWKEEGQYFSLFWLPSQEMGHEMKNFV